MACVPAGLPVTATPRTCVDFIGRRLWMGGCGTAADAARRAVELSVRGQALWYEAAAELAAIETIQRIGRSFIRAPGIEKLNGRTLAVFVR